MSLDDRIPKVQCSAAKELSQNIRSFEKRRFDLLSSSASLAWLAEILKGRDEIANIRDKLAALLPVRGMIAADLLHMKQTLKMAGRNNADELLQDRVRKLRPFYENLTEALYVYSTTVLPDGAASTVKNDVALPHASGIRSRDVSDVPPALTPRSTSVLSRPRYKRMSLKYRIGKSLCLCL